MTMRTSMSTRVPSAPSIDHVAQREHARTEAQLEVDGRDELPLVDSISRMRLASARSRPIGFCISTRGAFGQLLQDAEDLIARDREVEDDSTQGTGLLERMKHASTSNMAAVSFAPAQFLS